MLWSKKIYMIRKKSMFTHFGIIILFSFLYASVSFSAEDIETPADYIVVASLSPVDRTEAGAVVTVITADDIKRRGTTFLADILREVPGLAFQRSGSFGTKTSIRIRGAEANHTLVFIDGIEANNPALSEFEFEFLTADNIERVEILRGAQSALWGSDAIGGVINIITKKGAGPLAVNADLQGGSFDTGKTSLNVAWGNSLIDINLHAGILRTDGINIARDGDEEDGHRNRTYDLKLGFTPNNTVALSYVHRIVKAKTETDPQPSVVVVDEAGNRTDVDQVYQQARARLALFDGRWVNHVSFENTRYRSDFTRPRRDDSFSNGDKRKYTWKSDFGSWNLWNSVNDFSFLYEYEKDVAKGRSLRNGDEVSYITRSYAGEYRVALLKRLFISVSARHDDSSDIFDDATTYRITTAFKPPAGKIRWHVAYGTGVKNPTLTELFGTFATFTGNPDLRPESSKGWDVGLERSFFDGRLKADLTYFRNRITDLIYGFGTVTNLEGTNRIDGLELTFSLSPLQHLDIKGAYTFMRADDADDQELLRRPKHIASLNLNYAFYDDRANLNMAINYHGRQRDIFRTTLSAYTLINLTASYQLNEHVRFFGRIDNLLDEAYEDIYSYTAPGIGAFAGIGLTF